MLGIAESLREEMCIFSHNTFPHIGTQLSACDAIKMLTIVKQKGDWSWLSRMPFSSWIISSFIPFIMRSTQLIPFLCKTYCWLHTVSVTLRKLSCSNDFFYHPWVLNVQRMSQFLQWFTNARNWCCFMFKLVIYWMVIFQKVVDKNQIESKIIWIYNYLSNL